jgi:hypothetical protein
MPSLVTLDLRVLDAIARVLSSDSTTGSARIYRQLTGSGAFVTPSDFHRSLERLHASGAIQIKPTALTSRTIIGEYLICFVDVAVVSALRYVY